jgi:hypothetical protein
MAIWNILRTFGIFYDHMVHFLFIWYILFRFWYQVPRKIWQPWSPPATEETGAMGREIESRHGIEEQLLVEKIMAP